MLKTLEKPARTPPSQTDPREQGCHAAKHAALAQPQKPVLGIKGLGEPSISSSHHVLQEETYIADVYRPVTPVGRAGNPVMKHKVQLTFPDTPVLTRTVTKNPDITRTPKATSRSLCSYALPPRVATVLACRP